MSSTYENSSYFKWSGETVRYLRKRFSRATVLLLCAALAGAVILRGVHTWPRADSHNRFTDTALDRGIQLLSAPLPAHSHLFATVDDALALQYLLQIWQLRPDLTVVSSPLAAARLAAGEPVYSTWDATPLLQSELPDSLAYTRIAPNPGWIRFQPSAQPIATPALAQQPSIEIVPGLFLQGYASTIADEALIGEPRLQQEHPQLNQGLGDTRSSTAIISGVLTKGVTVTLLWKLEEIAWPADLSISVRLTAAGVPLAGAQQDRAMPTRGLSEPQQGLWLDPYFFQLYQEQLHQNDDSAIVPQTVDGFMVIVYRQVGEEFENVAVLQF